MRLVAACIVLLCASPCSAQVVSSAAENDMDPTFGADGWANVTGSYDVITEPGGFISHAWLEPPDGNTYGGGVQFGGVPGITEAIQKTIAGLTPGTAYAVEWYMMSDRVQGSATEDVWFDVTFCGTTVESSRISFTRAREWIREVRVFTANAASCALRFAARNPSGNNSNWIFLDSVAVSVARSSDLAITATGPAVVSPGESGSVDVTVSNAGPDLGSAPVVTYALPAGTSVNGGAAGPLTVGGADSASWTCSADGGTPQRIVCTRASALGVGATSAFSLVVAFDPAPGAMLTSIVAVAPTPEPGLRDPSPGNDAASFVTRTTACGDGLAEGTEACDDANVAAGDGCSSACVVEPGFTCPMAGMLCAPICGDGLVLGAEACDDGNETPADGCSACLVDDGWACTGAPSTCAAAACGDGIVAGAEACDDGDVDAGDGCDAACVVEEDFTCGGSPSVCMPGTCGDGLIARVEDCDDGGMLPGDGCSATCALEAGWTCTGVPSVCATTCGDGLRRGSEACDDGNTSPSDGCDASCVLEDGWTCDGADPSDCTPECGDGLVRGDEECDDGDLDAGDGCDASCRIEPAGCDGGACDAGGADAGGVVASPSGCGCRAAQPGSPGPAGLLVLLALALALRRRRAA